MVPDLQKYQICLFFYTAYALCHGQGTELIFWLCMSVPAALVTFLWLLVIAWQLFSITLQCGSEVVSQLPRNCLQCVFLYFLWTWCMAKDHPTKSNLKLKLTLILLQPSQKCIASACNYCLGLL